MDLAVQREQQRHRVLRDGMRRICWDTHHRDAMRLRGGEIDIVEARATQRDESHAMLREHLDAGRIDAIIHKHTHRLRPRRSGGRVRI